MIRTFAPVVALAFVLVAAAPAAPQPQKAALDAGFGEVDRLLTRFMTDRHVPGAAWGIIIDGELAHTRRRRAIATSHVEGAGRRRTTVFRIASMTKSFTAIVDPQAARRRQAVARRSGGALRPGDEGARRIRRATRRGSRSAICCRTPKGFPRTTRGATSSSPTPTTQLSAMIRARHPVLERAGRRLRVLELRVRDPRPHRRRRVVGQMPLRRRTSRRTSCGRSA